MYKNSKWSEISKAVNSADGTPCADLTVFYDGQCIVCAREVNHYRQLDRVGRLCWIDISAPGFDPSPHGVSSAQLMAAMHVRSADGCWHVGVAAFVAIWQRLPGRRYRALAWLATCRLWRPLLDLGYRWFARYRHYLPRHARACVDGACAVRDSEKAKGG